jgi:hypothetical protein
MRIADSHLIFRFCFRFCLFLQHFALTRQPRDFWKVLRSNTFQKSLDGSFQTPKYKYRRYLYFGVYVPRKPLVAMGVTSKNFIDDRTKKKSWAYHLD